MGVLESELAGLILFDPVFLLHDMSEQPPVREALVAGQFEIIIPMGE